MSFLVAVFSLGVMIVGLLGLASPDALTAFVRRWQTPLGIWFAAVLRLAFGGALWLAAPSSRLPVFLKVLGVASVASGVALPLLGLERLEAIISWWARRSVVVQRMWAGVALAFGAFVLWAVTV